jgi:hypothetical protein
MTKKNLTGVFVFFTMLFFAANAFTAPVPATGQTQCYNVAGDMIPCPEPGPPPESLYGQDANYAYINPMSYTKLGGGGDSLSDYATSWVMVRDNVTGLIWENKQGLLDGVKNYDNPHDPDNTYTWFDPTAPYRGTPGNGTDSKDFIDALNSASFGSFNDWRLPTAKELGTIVNYSIPYPGPTIDSGFFQSTVPAFYWSSTTYAYNTSFAWGVYFDAPFLYGYDFTNDKSTSRYVRAVRGGLTGGAYVSNGDGTVTDTSTGLMWQQTGFDITMTWEAALTYCENLILPLGGKNDWRMPNIKELRNLVDQSRYNPAINTMDFADTVPSFYWSSTTPYHGTDYAWGVYFNFGVDHYNHKIGGGYVRAVRGGQAPKLAASFLNSGLWIYDSGSANSKQVSSVNPENMIYSGSTLYVDLGASYGLYKLDGASWTKLTSSDPENMVTSGSTLYVDFEALGLWKWDGTAWSRLTPANPENMVTSGSTLYADFGATGLWKWDGTTWSRITSINPENMVTSGSTLYVDFGASYGLYKWDGIAWSQLTSANPENMVTSGSTLYVDFGASYGLYKWDGTAWSQLTSANPENMVTSGSTLYVDFGATYGLYKWDGTAWSQLTPANPENMVASGSSLYVGFGTSYGLYKWDGTAWSQLTSANPEKMAVSN